MQTLTALLSLVLLVGASPAAARSRALMTSHCSFTASGVRAA